MHKVAVPTLHDMLYSILCYIPYYVSNYILKQHLYTPDLCCAGGRCSYDSIAVTLSILCYVPNTTLLSDLQHRFVQPAFKKQLDTLQRKIVRQGSLQPWTAFQVLLLFLFRNCCNDSVLDSVQVLLLIYREVLK